MMSAVAKRKRPRRSHSAEFKAQIADLVRKEGRSIRSVAEDFDLSEASVRYWVKQADVEDGHREGLKVDEQAELARLRRENRQLREDVEILKRATAFFAKETR